MATDLRGKVAVVTGSSNGIGAETAIAFAREGARVVITYKHDRKSGEMVAARCRAAGALAVLTLQLDICSDDSIQDAVRKIIASFGHIDVLVNNAGMLTSKSLQNQTYRDIDLQICANITGLIKMTRACLVFIRGAIINIGSGAGKNGYAELSVYCATKFAVRGFTQSLAQEVQVPVYCVNPGMTATRMTNFKGVPSPQVAAVIVQAAKGYYEIPSGSDIDLWKVLEQTQTDTHAA